MKNLKIDNVKKEELNLLLDLIIELAVYEGAEDKVGATVDSLEKAIFDEKIAKAKLLRYDGQVIGYLIYAMSFSTFAGTSTIYIDDLYVKEKYRKKGIGTAVFKYLAELAYNNNYNRIDWYCMKTNLPSIKYYKSINAEQVDWIHVFRLHKGEINKMVEGDKNNEKEK